MSKLISKKEVIDCLLHTIRELQRKNEETYVCNNRVQRIHALKYAIHDIEAIPAAEIQPVRHGEWEDEQYLDFYGCFIATCSVCGQDSIDLSPLTDSHRYCTYCGARMDLKDGDIE